MKTAEEIIENLIRNMYDFRKTLKPIVLRDTLQTVYAIVQSYTITTNLACDKFCLILYKYIICCKMNCVSANFAIKLTAFLIKST